MAYGQRESLSHLLSPVGYNVLSNLFITCLCLNVFFDKICKYLRISGECLSGAVRKARNRIIKGRNRIASGGRIREFCNQRGVLELPAGFSLLEKRGSHFDYSFFPFLLHLSWTLCFVYIYITCLCPNIFCSRFGNSLINDELQRINEIKRGVIECKGGEIELSSQED